MRLEEQLAEVIEERLTGLTPAVPAPAEVRRRGRALRRRRHLAALAGVAVLVGGASVAVAELSGSGAESGVDTHRIDPVGPLDYGDGLRAYASPDADGEVFLGGRSFPKKDMGFLDTDASATPYGMVFFDGTGRAHLLTESGEDRFLAPAPAEQVDGFRPSVQADAALPLVAFTQPHAGGVRVHLHDLETLSSVDTIDVPCSGEGCEGVRVDGLDRGLAFVRTPDGTFVWDRTARGARRWTLLGAGELRVASARNGRVLWSGARPVPAAGSPVATWSFTEGPVDAELSHDGRYVLYWSTELTPTEAGGRPVRLQAEGIWLTFDTDGSVLVAGIGRGGRHPIHDCLVPSGVCERIGTLTASSGDPMFIGNDM